MVLHENDIDGVFVLREIKM